MKKISILIIITISIAFNVKAQTKQESIKLLFQVMQVDSMMEKMFSNVLPTIQKQMQSYYMSDTSLIKKRETMFENIMKISKNMATKMMNDDMFTLYDKYFTQAEIEDYIKFYQSPSGKKFTQLMPEMQKEIMEISMKKYMPEMQKLIRVEIHWS
ncbi:MAG: DUF2059 domain-containing protein [Bacteroidetes bacterium]|nr:DUF2059 domain-containing protein [Bacteroidota bacterium]